MAAETKNNRQNNKNHHEQPHNQQHQKCSCTACGSHMHCSVGPSRTQPIDVDPSRIQLSNVDPSRIQRSDIPCSQSVAAKSSSFSSGIKSLRWICWVNLEPQTWLFSQLSSSNQNFTLGGLPATERVRLSDLSFAQMFFHRSSALS